MYYLTFNDQPSGIYQSQVIDVVAHLSKLKGEYITLIAFLPIRGFHKNRTQIRKQWSNSIVIPMLFGISRWKMHEKLLKIRTKRNSSIICRGPLATALALGNFKKVVYDGRAAVKAEVEEYDVTGGNVQLSNDFIQAERQAVVESDFRIAVSHKLVEYWKREFDYTDNKHVVIPCTLTSQFKETTIGEQTSDVIRVVYSGSTSGWQSFGKVVELLDDLLQRQENVVVLFLTHQVPEIDELMKRYPNRVQRKFVSHDTVQQELMQCDYGILIRDNTVTNQVASPVKFAEYLHAGLQVLIADNLGDFSEFVRENNCGVVITHEIPILADVKPSLKQQNSNLAKLYFQKDAIINDKKYTHLIHFITNENAK
jgi:hypothetical protein